MSEEINGNDNLFKEKASIKNNSPCNKCNLMSNYVIIHSCGHEICLNCIFKYYMSNNFKGLTVSSIKIVCPICKEGEEEINLDDWIELLNEMLLLKNQNYNNINTDNNEDNFCPIHKDKIITKICTECKTNLCEKCLREIHNRYFENHKLIDKNKNNKIKNNINNQIIEDIKNNKEINELQENETRFMQKLESDNIMLQTKISQLIKDLNSFLEMLNNKINIFQNNMKKIFQIINLSYYNYQISDMQVKKEITITKKLIDFNMISKKIDLNELLFAYQKLLKNFEEDKPIYNFEFKFEGEEYKKIYSLKPSDNDSDSPECVTKILELKKTNKLISGLISGQIYIWDLYSKSLDYSINAHKSAIWAMIKLSNDNIATGSSDKLIKIFDIVNQSSEPIIKFRGHKGTIFCIGEIEKNKIISGSEDKTIKLWDLNTKKCILSLEDPNDSKINCLYTLKDYGFIITGGDDNLIKIWNIHSKYIPNVLSGHECTIWSLTSLNDDDSIIASGSSDNTIKIWDLFNLRCLFTLEGHENTISSLKLLNNDLLVSSSWDKTAKIWNLRTRNCVYTLKGHKNIVWDVIQLDSGDLATCSSDMNIIVWSKSQ